MKTINNLEELLLNPDLEHLPILFFIDCYILSSWYIVYRNPTLRSIAFPTDFICRKLSIRYNIIHYLSLHGVQYMN